MRFSTLSAFIVANSLCARAAEESLSAAVAAVPDCAVYAFKNALENQGCDTKNVGAATFDCLCKQLTNISEIMAASAAKSELNSDCLANWATALTGVCGFWSAASTSASDYPAATKALASELGSTAATGKLTVGGADPTTASPAGSDTTSTGTSTEAGAATTTSQSKALGAVATPVAIFVGAAAMAGFLV